MSGTRRFDQRRFGVRTEFDFADDDFGYGLRDTQGGRGWRIAYEALDIAATGSLTVPNERYLTRWMWLPYPVAIVALMSGHDAVALPVFAAALASSVALFLAAMWEWTAVRFTEIATLGADAQGVRGFVRIVQDEQHDAILAALTERWRARLRTVAGGVDPAADPAMEAMRLRWLRDRGVLSEVEVEWALAQLGGYAADGAAVAH